MTSENHFHEKNHKIRNVVSSLYETLELDYNGVALRYLIDDTKDGKSVLQLMEQGKIADAKSKIDKIYNICNINEKDHPKENLIDIINMAIEIDKENNSKKEDQVIPPVEVIEPKDHSPEEVVDFSPEEDSDLEVSQNDFNEEKYEKIFDEIYNKFLDPDLYKEVTEEDIISYVQADIALESGNFDEKEIGINDIFDAYDYMLLNQNIPDIRGILVWFLPKIQEKIILERNILNDKIIKVWNKEITDSSVDEINLSIQNLDNLQKHIDEFKDTLHLVEPVDEKDNVYTTTPRVSRSLKPLYSLRKNIVSAPDVKEDNLEKTPEEKFEELLFNKGITTIVIHGTMIESKKIENEWFLKPKLDFDADSAIMILDELGAKYNKGYNYTWVHPEAKIKEDKSGNFYFEYNNEKVYLTEGTVIFDVGKGNGLKMLKDGISMIDHHGDGNKDVTSTTQILVESARGFKKYKDKKEEFPEYLKNYADLVTLVDNLSMDTDMGREDFLKNYANTMPALVPLLYNKNPKILLDFFKKYPDVSLDGFSKKELKYPVGVREYTSISDNRSGFTGIKIYSEIPKDYNPNFIYEEFTIEDAVKNQQKVIENSVKEIDYHVQKMFRDGLKTDSPIIGKTVFIDQKSFKYIDSNGGLRKYDTYANRTFGTVTAYNLGYESVVILDRSEGNCVFISSKNKKGLEKFAENFKIYYDNSIIVRDSMFILRDINLKNENPEYIRNAIIDSAQIDGFNATDYNKTIDDLLQEIRENK